MAGRSPSPVALLRARYNMTPREFARALGITPSHLRGLERWLSPSPEWMSAMEQFVALHAEIAAGWPARLERLREASSYADETQLSLFDFAEIGKAASRG